MKKITYKYITTRTTKEPRIGDIWLAHVQYDTPGNMEKVRPIIIKKIIDNESYVDTIIIANKLTTKKHKKNKEFVHPKISKKTYMSGELVKIKPYQLIRYIGRSGLYE